MSRFITPPDSDFGTYDSILMNNYSESEVELIALTAKCTARDVDVYLYKDDYNDPEWLAKVESTVNKTFSADKNKINEIVEYFQPK